MVDLSIVIVSYNTKKILQECLSSVKDNEPKSFSCEIIAADNCSSDGSLEMLKNKFPKVLVLANNKNLGFAKANNQAVSRAKGKYVLFLNSDTVVGKNTLETMVKFMEDNKNAGAATCFVKLPNGQIDDACHRGFPTPIRSFFHFSRIGKLFSNSQIFNGYHLGFNNINKIHEIEALAGAFMMVRRQAGEDVGWWDENYFWYGDDLDFCYRLKEKGWKIYFVPEVSILHYKGASGGIKKISKHLSVADTETKKMAQKARFDAMRIFYKKHYAGKYPKVVNWLILNGIDLKQTLHF